MLNASCKGIQWELSSFRSLCWVFQQLGWGSAATWSSYFPLCPGSHLPDSSRKLQAAPRMKSQFMLRWQFQHLQASACRQCMFCKLRGIEHSAEKPSVRKVQESEARLECSQAHIPCRSQLWGCNPIWGSPWCSSACSE